MASAGDDQPEQGDLTRRAALGIVGAGVAPLLRNDQAVTAPTAGLDADRILFRQPNRDAVGRSVLDKLRDVVSVKDFGARGDGVANDTAAIQAAFLSGARRVIFPPGRYLTGALRVPDWLHIQGEAYQPSIGGDGRAAELRFQLRSGAGFTCGANPVIQNLFIQNIGGIYNEDRKELTGTTAQAISLTENAVIQDCSFSLWNECIRTGGSTYYLKTSRLHFNRCNFGYRTISGPAYNMHIDAPHSVLTRAFIAGKQSYAPRNVKVFGGSIEGYTSVSEFVSEISFFGTYFETAAPRANVVAINPRIDRASVALFGCLIYMNRTARFVSLAGLAGAALTSVGNVFDGIGQSGGTCLHLPASGTVALHGDRLGSGHPNDCLYLDSIESAVRFNVVLPALPPGNLQAMFGGLQLMSPRGFAMGRLTAEPSEKVLGMTVMADGRTWDPLRRSSSGPYWTMWNGERWSPLSG